MGVGTVMKQEFKGVFLNEYGYYELVNPPTAEERKKVFESEYYQNSMSSYEQVYTKEELKYFENKLEQKEFMLRSQFPKEKENYTLLDIGCGEGFALAHFKKSGFEVTGIDFSTYGISHHNPEVVDCMIAGDCEEILPTFIEQGRKFDIINMDSVLDMMVNPKKILTLCREILTEEGVLLIKVANNYSLLQQHLLEEGKLSDTHWLDQEGHPSYFNREGLIHLLNDYGYECLDTFGESFIDLNLVNDDTNYYEKAGVGKNCYWAKVDLENFMHQLSMEKTLEVFRILGEMGLGREVIGLFRMKKEKG